MKVLHAVHTWLEQTETWLYQQVRFLPPEVENHVVCGRAVNLDQFPCEHLHALAGVPLPGRCWDRLARRLGLRHHMGHLVAVARREGTRLLHSHFGHLAWKNLAAAHSTGMRHVATFYGMDVHQLPFSDPLWLYRYRQLFEGVDLVLAEGPHMASCIARLGCPAGKLHVHHLGVDVESIPFTPRSWAPGERLRVLIAASFREKKGIPDALRALRLLRDELPLEIVVVGDAGRSRSSRVEKERILWTVEDQGLAGEVRFLGYQPYDRLLALARESHVFLAPSVTAADGDTEGGAPVTLIDMAASGMPIVSTRHCDIPSVIEDGVTGALADEGDVEGLAEALRRLVRGADSWSDMLVAARRRVEAEFNARIQGQRLAGVYRSVLEGRPPGDAVNAQRYAYSS